MKICGRNRLKTAIVVEGDGEYKSLPLVLNKLKADLAHPTLRPVRIAVTPNAPDAKIARECVKALKIAQALGATRAIVLLDREQVTDTPHEIATRLTAEIEAQFGSSLEVMVVLKDRAFENWLVADMGALAAQTARYTVTQALRRRVEPNKADRTNAIAILNSAANRIPYHKIDDAYRLCKHLDPLVAASNSRSFRHFLHALGHARYAGQCRVPS
jgi:Domain of unknown function (DUF4276)